MQRLDTTLVCRDDLLHERRTRADNNPISIKRTSCKAAMKDHRTALICCGISLSLKDLSETREKLIIDLELAQQSLSVFYVMFLRENCAGSSSSLLTLE